MVYTYGIRGRRNWGRTRESDSNPPPDQPTDDPLVTPEEEGGRVWGRVAPLGLKGAGVGRRKIRYVVGVG